MFVVAYPRETQEMVLDAHNQDFVFIGGVPKRMVVYFNLKTVVDAIITSINISARNGESPAPV